MVLFVLAVNKGLCTTFRTVLVDLAVLGLEGGARQGPGVVY